MTLEHAKLMAASAWVAAIVTVGLVMDASTSSAWFLLSVVAIGPALMLFYLWNGPAPQRALARVPTAGEHGWMSAQWLAEQRNSHQQ